MKSLSHLFLPALAGLLVLLPIEPARAQVQVALDLDRQIYIAHEPISAKLTVINRAGRDLVFGNVNGRSWLDFSVTDARGHLISPVSNEQLASPMIIASGQTHQMRVVINRVYPMGNIGSYRVKASVSFPQINRVFQSRMVTVQVAEGRPYWSQIVGVPPGYPGEGNYRVYELLTYFHGSRQKALYFRLKDNATGRVLRCYSLGDYLSVRPPKQAIDNTNQLHILHMSAPQQYVYTVVDLAGEVLVRESYFEHKGSRPTLVTNSYGEISLQGGITEDEAKTPYERREFRLMSERPPDIPSL